MLSFLKKFIPRLFISVILREKKNSLRTATYLNGKFTNIVEKSFEDPHRLFAYIKNSQKKYFYYYTSLFLNSEEQWLVPSLDSNEFENFITTKVSVKSIVLNNARLYTATEHIEHFTELFEDNGGLDFLFSPLALLYYCIQKENLERDKISLCVYKNSNNLALIACKGQEILIGEFKLFEKDIGLELDGFESQNEEIINETTEEQVEQEDELENFNENFGEEFKDKLDLSNQEQKAEFDEFSNFSDDMEFCNYIISSIEKFYKDTRYAGDFIDKLLIFTNEDITQSALEFLENEILLTPQVKSLNTLDLMIELMQKELRI
ncbi:clan AA aspartic protease [Campylobacter cuniculorum]|uniref:clan AA aspartic protease n=1 Tax=Campylobacter cuniculorum TaxID=374106 RepID=UPI0023F202B0|nr:clan AA aspartic protease [Campylobacter cuniculorum]